MLLVVNRRVLLEKVQEALTLRYICPCPPAVPLSSTDWLIVDVAEAPAGRLLVDDPDPDVTVACQIITSDLQCVGIGAASN